MLILDLTLNGAQVIGILAFSFVIILGIIAGAKYYYRKKSKEIMDHTHSSSQKIKWTEKNKYEELDPFKLSGLFWKLGLVISLGLIVAAFSWTEYNKKVDISKYMLTLEEDLEIEDAPRTAEPPPPPPPAPPTVEAVPDNEIIEEDQPVFMDQSLDADTEVAQEEPVVMDEAAPPPPPPPPPPPAPEEEEIFKVVEDMPRFPGCEDLGSTKTERQQCANKKMLEFLYSNIKYPAIARENGVEGTVVVQFVVEKDGSVTNAEIVRDIGAQCGDEALRVINLMSKQNIKWIPGRQRERNVRVQFYLPVKFDLKTS